MRRTPRHSCRRRTTTPPVPSPSGKTLSLIRNRLFASRKIICGWPNLSSASNMTRVPEPIIEPEILGLDSLGDTRRKALDSKPARSDQVVAATNQDCRSYQEDQLQHADLHVRLLQPRREVLRLFSRRSNRSIDFDSSTEDWLISFPRTDSGHGCTQSRNPNASHLFGSERIADDYARTAESSGQMAYILADNSRSGARAAMSNGHILSRSSTPARGFGAEDFYSVFIDHSKV